jgi:hypothetical protein
MGFILINISVFGFIYARGNTVVLTYCKEACRLPELAKQWTYLSLLYSAH